MFAYRYIFVLFHQTVHDLKKGRFARTVRSQDADELSLSHLELDAAKSLGPVGVGKGVYGDRQPDYIFHNTPMTRSNNAEKKISDDLNDLCMSIGIAPS